MLSIGTKLVIMELREIGEVLLFWRALRIQPDFHPIATLRHGPGPEMVKWARWPCGTHL